MLRLKFKLELWLWIFWASLEHKLKYKPQSEITKASSKELVTCAKMVHKLDNKMMSF